MQKNRNIFYKIIFFSGAFLLTGTTFLFYYFNSRISTENAYLKSNMAPISPRVTGYINSIIVKDNQKVSKGDPLLYIDSRDYEAKVSQAEALLESTQAQIRILENKEKSQEAKIQQAQATINQAHASFIKSKKDLKRAEKLTPEGVITLETLDGATATYKTAHAGLLKNFAELESSKSDLASLKDQISQAKSQLKAAQAQLTLAKIDLENTTLKAPSDGTWGNRLAQIGQLVRPGSILGYLVPSEIWVEANFKETQIEKVKPGQDAFIQVDAFPGVTFLGKVDSLSPSSGSEFSLLPPENATGNFTKIVRRIPIKIVFKEKENTNLLRQGLSSVVTIQLR